jgi:hypothetical protein
MCKPRTFTQSTKATTISIDPMQSKGHKLVKTIPNYRLQGRIYNHYAPTLALKSPPSRKYLANVLPTTVHSNPSRPTVFPILHHRLVHSTQTRSTQPAHHHPPTVQTTRPYPLPNPPPTPTKCLLRLTLEVRPPSSTSTVSLPLPCPHSPAPPPTQTDK